MCHFDDDTRDNLELYQLQFRNHVARHSSHFLKSYSSSPNICLSITKHQKQEQGQRGIELFVKFPLKSNKIAQSNVAREFFRTRPWVKFGKNVRCSCRKLQMQGTVFETFAPVGYFIMITCSYMCLNENK